MVWGFLSCLFMDGVDSPTISSEQLHVRVCAACAFFFCLCILFHGRLTVHLHSGSFPVNVLDCLCLLPPPPPPPPSLVDWSIRLLFYLSVSLLFVYWFVCFLCLLVCLFACLVNSFSRLSVCFAIRSRVQKALSWRPWLRAECQHDGHHRYVLPAPLRHPHVRQHRCRRRYLHFIRHDLCAALR